MEKIVMQTRRKSIKNTKSETKKSSKNKANLEQIYRQYLVPIPLETWSRTVNLSQPSILKQVPTRTAYSSVGVMDA